MYVYIEYLQDLVEIASRFTFETPSHKLAALPAINQPTLLERACEQEPLGLNQPTLLDGACDCFTERVKENLFD